MKLKIKDVENVSHETLNNTKYVEWLEYGRIRKCAKAIDCYSVLVERGGSLYIYLSTGQMIKADKFKGVKDGYYLARVQNLKGMFFCGELELNEPFDADKLYLVQDSKLDSEFVNELLYPTLNPE